MKVQSEIGIQLLEGFHWVKWNGGTLSACPLQSGWALEKMMAFFWLDFGGLSLVTVIKKQKIFYEMNIIQCGRADVV